MKVIRRARYLLSQLRRQDLPFRARFGLLLLVIAPLCAVDAILWGQGSVRDRLAGSLPGAIYWALVYAASFASASTWPGFLEAPPSKELPPVPGRVMARMLALPAAMGLAAAGIVIIYLHPFPYSGAFGVMLAALGGIGTARLVIRFGSWRQEPGVDS